MASEDRPGTFNEQAALAELERLQRALEASRQRRKQATAAFDDFVGSFKKDEGHPDEAVSVRREPRLAAAVIDAPPMPVEQTTTSAKWLPRARIFAGAAVAIAAGLVLTRVWRGSPTQPSSAEPVAVPPAAAGQSGSVAQASDEPAGAQSTASAPPAEIIAIRDVWVRATVDGERVLERELEAGARVPLRAARTIVIRAGNAGALRIAIGGQDRGPLGPEGQALTRTFALSPAANR